MCYAVDTLDTSSTLTNYLSKTFDLYQKSKRKLVQNDKFFFFFRLHFFPSQTFLFPAHSTQAVLFTHGRENGTG